MSSQSYTQSEANRVNPTVVRTISFSTDDASSLPGSCNLSSFSVDLSALQLKPMKWRLNGYEFPNQFYNVNANSNTLSYTVYQTVTNSTTLVTTTTAYPITVTIATNNYSATNFPTAVANAMSAGASAAISGLSSGTFTVTLNSMNNYTTITTATSGITFSINMIGSLDDIMGFRPYAPGNTLSNGVYTSPIVTSINSVTTCNLQPYSVVYLRCSGLGKSNYLSPKNASACIARIQNTASFGYPNVYENQNDNLHIYGCNESLSTLHFQLVDEWGNQLNCDLGMRYTFCLDLIGESF